AGAARTAASPVVVAMTTTTPAAMRSAAGMAEAGGTSPKAIHASAAAPTISNRIATDTATGLIVRSTRLTTVWPSSCGPAAMATSASHVHPVYPPSGCRAARQTTTSTTDAAE